jgi:hypothetical protein
MTVVAWLLLVQIGYPSYGYVAIPGIRTYEACKQLATDLKAGPEENKDQPQRFPIWKCHSYEAVR